MPPKKHPKKSPVKKKGNSGKIPKRTVAPKDLPAELDAILTEQAKQKVFSQATEVAKVVYENEVSHAITNIIRRGLDREALIHELMTGAIVLNVHMHPDAKLNYIKTALVLDGSIESTSLGRRIAPLDDVPEAQSSVYASIFNRPTPTPTLDSPPLETPKEQVYDLLPPKPVAPTPPPRVVESVDPSQPTVITVEIG